ncbi:MAG: helicase-related protein [Methanomassiliicoccales archaeon]|nr:helicase-related protein [Methanomassiliicoccales archaeon]
MFVQHPLIKPNKIEDRAYQASLSRTCLETSTLIVLPTGMGKTVIALRVIAEILLKEGGKVLVLAPTKPLVEQHASFLRENLVGKRVVCLTGEVDPGEREVCWLENDVIVSTPQVIANDLRYERISLRDVRLIVFDEAHRAVGNYAYVRIAEEFKEYGRLVMGMTASPGSSGAKIEEVCRNLGIQRVEVRSESDPDVAPYMQDVEMQIIEVDIPDEMKGIIRILRAMFESCVRDLITLGLMDEKRPVTRKYLLEIGETIQERLNSGEKRSQLYRGLSLQAMALKINHALELAETQGATALANYLERIRSEAMSENGSRASRSIVQSDDFERIRDMLRRTKMEHPKLSRVMSIVSNQIIARPESRTIVFTHYRDTCELVASKLSKIEGARVAKLVGQAERGEEKGLKQKEQVEVLEKFRKGDFNVIVATSVGEEGLDVASTDLVIFYEPVPSEIRSIQRRGRTGRQRPGRVVILKTRGTRDDAYFFTSQRKEKAMRRRLFQINKELQNMECTAEKGGKGESTELKRDQKEGGQKTVFDFL